MIRLLVFLAVILALAFGFAWLADRPGEVAVVWQGTRIDTDVMVVAIGAIALVVAVMLVVTILRGVVGAPGSLGSFFSRRRREKGWRALSNGMIAVGAGDPPSAARLAVEARRILGDEPMALLLEAQSAQLNGDRDGARGAFEHMLEAPETRLLGLRGLYVEAQRYGDAAAARHFAEAASTSQPRIAWAGQALIEFQSQDRDWDGALGTLDRNSRNRIVEKVAARRQRAVLLTARALEIEQGEPDVARNLALEAHGLAPDLVPAAVLAGRLLARVGDTRRAARTLEATWKLEPHPDIATAYAFVRPGDSVQDRLMRVRDLIKVRAHHAECAFALTRAELDARNFFGARAALRPLVAQGPTRRVCLLMAEIEEAEHGDRGAIRAWLARAVRAARDPAWIADGHVSETWAPVSPVTGRLDGYRWQVPADLVPNTTADGLDSVLQSFDEAGTFAVLESGTIEVEPAAAAPTSGGNTARPANVVVLPQAQPAEPPPSGPAQSGPGQSGSGQSGSGSAARTIKTVSFPIDHPPDDPGPNQTDEGAADRRFRLFS